MTNPDSFVIMAVVPPYKQVKDRPIAAYLNAACFSAARFFSLAALLALPSWAWQSSPTPAESSSTAPSATPAKPKSPASTTKASASDTKESDKLLNRALRLQADPTGENLTEAVEVLHQATALNPADATLVTAEEVAKQQLAAEHVSNGNRLMNENRPQEARTEFRAALMLDPTNTYAAQRYSDSAPLAPEQEPIHLKALDYASEPVLTPADGAKTVNYRGDTRGLMQEIGKDFGIDVIFDPSFQPRPARFHLDNVDFFRAINVAQSVSKSFYVVVSSKQILVAAETPDNRKKMIRTSLRTFRLAAVTTPQELTEIQNLVRTMLDVRFVAVSTAANTIMVRAPEQTLQAVERLLDDLGQPKPEVMLEVHVIEVNHSLMRNIGVNLPLQFTMFNVNSEARSLLQSGSGLTGVLQQLANGANLSPTDLAAAAALLAAQQSGGSSPLLQPFATFGGGITRQGVNIPAASLHLELNESSFRSLQNVTLRAEQGAPATLHVGDRFPVLTQSFTQATRSLTGRQVNQEPVIPAFSYEDLGITLKATPQVSGKNDVTLALELQIRSLTGQSFNDVPTISNREYKGGITVKDGETSVITGYVTSSERRAVSGLPLAAKIPGLRLVTADTNKQVDTGELLVLITPHVVTSRDRKIGSESYLDGQ